jgi:hypothetical protein
MTIEEAWDAINFRGDAMIPADGRHDLRVMVAQVVSRLPEDVQDWLLYGTRHLFFGGSGQLGERFDLYVSPDASRGDSADVARLRMIFLSESLMDRPADEVLWTVAHEIAHSRLEHDRGGREAEAEADALAGAWGFVEPSGRAADREHHYSAKRTTGHA